MVSDFGLVRDDGAARAWRERSTAESGPVTEIQKPLCSEDRKRASRLVVRAGALHKADQHGNSLAQLGPRVGNNSGTHGPPVWRVGVPFGSLWDCFSRSFWAPTKGGGERAVALVDGGSELELWALCVSVCVYRLLW